MYLEWFLRVFKIQSKKQKNSGEKDKNSGNQNSGKKIKNSGKTKPK